jgi:GntR family transcriptional regulator
MNITISNTSDKPIYQQLFDQISGQIIKGELPCNYALPAIRTAAKELRISIITVKKAWEELERHGFIYTMAGKGCFVSDMSSGDMMDKRDEIAHKKMARDIAYYKELGYSKEELIQLLTDMFD